MPDEQWLAREVILRRLSAITAATPADDALTFFDRWQALKAAVRELDQLVTAAMIEVIEAQPRRELVVGTRRYYVGHRKETWCVDNAGTVRAILELLGPDILPACLTSQPFKPAAVRSVLTEVGCADEFGRLFKVKTKNTLNEGPAPKQILVADDRFR